MQSDKFVELIGHIGKWQIWICFIIFLIKFPSAWYQLAIIYLAPKIGFQCVDTSNGTDVFDSQCVNNCTEYVYDHSLFVNTIISEWEIICEKSWLKDFTQTMFMFGLLTGSTAFGYMADRFGRRKAFLTSVIMLIVFGIATAFATNYIMFSSFRFIAGFASGGTMVISFVICMELVGAQYREVIGILYQVPFVFGYMTLPAFAYYLRSWDTFTLGLTVPSLIFLAYYWLLPESPRWLIANGRINEASEVMVKAARTNKLNTDNMIEKVQKIAEELKCTTANTRKANFLDLVREPAIRIRTISSCVLWLCASLNYFGVAQYISQTSDDIFLSMVISGAVQLPGNFVAIYANKVFGRKKTAIMSYLLSGMCILIIGFIPLAPWMRLLVSSLGVSIIGISSCTIYIYSSELFPTVVRNMGMGISSAMARIGSMLAPFTVSLASTAPWLPPTIFGIAPLIAAAFCFLLPETKGTSLQDKLDDTVTTHISKD